MRAFLVVVALCGVLAYAVHRGAIVIPDRWNPWAPLDVAEPFNLLTRWKLMRLTDDSVSCLSALGRTPLRYERVPDRDTGPGCGVHDAVRVTATTARVGAPFVLTCRSAVSLALWETRVVQPAAQAYFGARVSRIEHFGSYACRNVYGREGGRRSRHATADAFDVAGFVLDDGRRIRVVNDWRDAGDAGAFLRDVRDGACRVFDGVFSPDYNAAHRDHLHLDRGPYRVCR